MIQKIINDITTKEAQAEREQVTGLGITGWRSSGLGTCMRGRFLNRFLSGTGIKPEIDTRTLHVFEMGNQVEEWLINKLTKQDEYLVTTQGEMYDPELNLSGHFDALLTDRKTGESHLLECKSKHSKAFWYMDKKGEGAQVHHKMQLHSYMYMINKYGYKLSAGSTSFGAFHRAEKIEKGSILYVSKDDMAMLEYPVFLKDTELEKMWKYEIETLNKCWEDKTAPPANAAGSWQDKYCDFCKAGMCSKLNDTMVKELFAVSAMPSPAPVAAVEQLIYLDGNTKEIDSLKVGDHVYLSDKMGFFENENWPVYGSKYSCAGTVVYKNGLLTTVKWDNKEELSVAANCLILIK